MRTIVIASGKGGTGKTTLTVNLAQALASEINVGVLDCDVEEPNCHLYLKPGFAPEHSVTTPVPLINQEACNACGLCARTCEFHALLALPQGPLLLPELCHSCGLCSLVCPEKAISETPREVGKLASGIVERLRREEARLAGPNQEEATPTRKGIYLRWGVLNIGEARAAPVIRAVKDLSQLPPLDLVLLDAPPGVACPVIETMRGADVAILVTEPTPFGLHDLELAVEAAGELGIPVGVVINRIGVGDLRVHEFCFSRGIPVWLEIPEDKHIAEACSRGEIIAASDHEFARKLRALADAALNLAERRGAMQPNQVSTLELKLSPATELELPPALELGQSFTAELEQPLAAEPKQLVVVSGKGGTGKTTVAGALTSLISSKVLADCDVDAPDLHLLLDPRPRHAEPFVGGKVVYMEENRCNACGICQRYCRFEAILAPPETQSQGSAYSVDISSCEGCGVCAHVCPNQAVVMQEAERGEWFISDTRHGTLVHARLNLGGENSGKLVALVKEKALELAREGGAALVLVDGPPGVSCPVISSASGAALLLAVTEPTVSAEHDLERLVQLARVLAAPLAVCINKVDVNPEIAERIRNFCSVTGIPVVGELVYDARVVQAQTEGKTVVETRDSPVADQIMAMWENVKRMLDER